MKHNIILLDGSAGTALWEAAERQGVEKVPVWRYNIEHPELVTELHRRYIEAGSRLIQTNTFSVNSHSVKQSSDYSVTQVVTEAVRLAKAVTEDTDVGVYLSFGPPAMLLEPYGKLSESELREMYAELCTAGASAGAEYIMLETFMDLRMMRIAAQEAVQCGIPVICSMTFDKHRRTIFGDTVQKIVQTLEPLGIAGIGMNCSFGPVEGLEIIKEFNDCTDLPLYFKPNAGMSDTYDAVQFADEIEPALDFVSYIGACCGSDASYIAELRRRIADK